MRTIHCDYCGRRAEYVDSRIIYGRSYGMVYYCAHCQAWTGVHKGTDTPLGRLANAELRHWKQKAHAAFDPIWKHRIMARNEAYDWLAERMELPRKQTHIGMFNVDQCKQVIRECERRFRK